MRFGAVGVASTLACLALFLLLRGGIGAQSANLVALLVTAIANTAANRRFTFGVRGGCGAAPGGHAEIAAVVLANLVATVLRFLLFRNWVFRPGV